MNVREQPTTSSKIVGKLKNKQVVEIASVKNGWGEISLNSKPAYVSLEFITKNQSATSIENWMTPTVSVLNVREAATIKSRVIGSLKKGEPIHITRAEGTWSVFVKDNKQHYVSTSYLTKTSKPSTPAPTPVVSTPAPIAPTPDPAITHPTEKLTGKVTALALNIREQPNTDSAIIGTYKQNDVVEYEKENASWAKVTFKNQTAYVYKMYLSGVQQETSKEVTPPKTTPTPITMKIGVISTEALNVRSEPNVLSNAQGLLKKGDEITILSTHGEWLGFMHQNKIAYVHGGFVTIQTQESSPIVPIVEEPKSDFTLGFVTASALNARELPDTTSKVLTVLSKDARVEIVHVENNWGKIKLNNEFAFISMSYIKYDSPEASEPAKETFSYSVNTATLNVRSSASINSMIVGKVLHGDTLEVLSEQGEWLEIKKDGQNGFVSKKYTQKTAVDSINTPDVSLTGKTIVVDAGHGGKDTGAIGNGLREKDVALDVSLKLKSKLEKAGANVIMTRTNDTYYSLSERVNVSNASNADLFISIHINAADANSASGIETFYFDSGDIRAKNSLKLAQVVQRDLINQLGLGNRGVKTAYFQVIRYTQAPSILAELGFVSNSYDASKLAQNAVRDKYATSLFSGIQTYFE